MNTRKKAQERATPAVDAGGGEGEEKPTLPMTVSVGVGLSVSVGMGVGVGSVGVGVSPLPGTPDLLTATTGTTTTAVMTSTSSAPAVLESPSVGAARVTPRLGGLGSKRTSEASDKGGTANNTTKRRAITTTGTTSAVAHPNTLPETPIPRPAAPLSRLAEYAAVGEQQQQQPPPQTKLQPHQQQPRLGSKTPSLPPQQDSRLQDDSYVFLIRPLMGSSFTVILSRDSSLFDLKDAIFAKVGITPDMQLLAVMDQYQQHHQQQQQHQGKVSAVNFDNEEQFLEDLALPRLCTLYLSVRATTGQQVLNDIYLGEDELFVYDIMPVVGGGGGQDKNTSNSIGGESANVDVNVTPTIAVAIANGTASDEPGVVDTETDADADAHVTVPMSSLPLPVLQSYLLRSDQDRDGTDEDAAAEHDRDDPHELEGQQQLPLHVADGLESLRITIRDGDFDEDGESLSLSAIPPRPATPFPATTREFHRPQPSGRQQQQDAMAEEQTAPPLSSGPIRCGQCGIRCRLASQFECRCGRIFCPQHRYHDTHNCTFDHKNHDRARLTSANPRVYKPTLDQL